MKITKYIKALLPILLLTAASCSDTKSSTEESGGVPVGFSGLMTRSDGVNGSNIYLTAYYNDGGALQYMSEVLISFPSGLGQDPREATFPASTPYYPLNQRGINFFAYSGKTQNQNMVLVAGNGSTFDAVLSNQGYTGGNLSAESSGTFGSSVSPADILLFRHVMTQLEVAIEVNEDEEGDHVSPAPQHIWFRVPVIYSKGTYHFKSTSSTPATPSGIAQYTVREGINYLVPTGEDITGLPLTYLKIDDYTATAGDLSQFVITPDTQGDRMRLLPGYAYKLTLVINRLRVTEAKISLVPWKTAVVDDVDESYLPQTLTLDTGSYQNTGTDAITKVVLYTQDKMYVGKKESASALIDFVTMPPAGEVTGIELYTTNGMLLKTDNAAGFTYNGSALRFQRMSAAGMLPENPSSDYNASTNPYSITTASQFINADMDLSASYKQAANIDLNTLNLIDEARLFNGFGDVTATGVYDGNGFFIAGLDIQSPGLFASNAGTLKNVRILSGIIDAVGQQYAGAICGVNSGEIAGCFNEAAILSSGDDAGITVGGIVGRNTATGKVTACLNTGAIFNGGIVGGIVGMNENGGNGVIAACVTTGSLNKNAVKLGAICGNSVASLDLATIRTCYWLIGSAQRNVGGVERAVDTDAGTNVWIFRAAALDPDELRNITSSPSTGGQLVTEVLNEEVADTAWRGIYEYVVDRQRTGITWPAPVKAN